MKAVVADPVGGVENLRFVDIDKPKLAPGEVLVKLESIGVNFIDVYFRTGFYKAPESPIRLGSEGAGVVAEVGVGAKFSVGERVAYAMSRGSYAEYAAIPQQFLVHLPEDVTFDQGAAVMLQGMTAHYLTRSTFKLDGNHTCLVHAAAGGAGLLIVQIAKLAGATVIGTCSTDEKARVATQNGADNVIRYTETDFVSEVKRLTNGGGVDVVYDSIGKTTFLKSLDCIKPRGLMVTFGQSSGAVGEIDPLLLVQKGSLYLTRPNLASYIADPDELAWRASELFGWIAKNRLKLHIHRKYKLAQAAEAHRELEARTSIGKLLLQP